MAKRTEKARGTTTKRNAAPSRSLTPCEALLASVPLKDHDALPDPLSPWEDLLLKGQDAPPEVFNYLRRVALKFLLLTEQPPRDGEIHAALLNALEFPSTRGTNVFAISHHARRDALLRWAYERNLTNIGKPYLALAQTVGAKDTPSGVAVTVRQGDRKRPISERAVRRALGPRR